MLCYTFESSQARSYYNIYYGNILYIKTVKLGAGRESPSLFLPQDTLSNNLS